MHATPGRCHRSQESVTTLALRVHSQRQAGHGAIIIIIQVSGHTLAPNKDHVFVVCVQVLLDRYQAARHNVLVLGAIQQVEAKSKNNTHRSGKSKPSVPQSDAHCNRCSPQHHVCIAVSAHDTCIHWHCSVIHTQLGCLYIFKVWPTHFVWLATTWPR
jgi:hypothetical protein